MEKLKLLLKKLINKETLTYIIFGVLTTAVNLLSFKAFDLLFNGKYYALTNTIAWFFAVAFAYVTNKLFVFESKSWRFGVIKKEIPTFLGARIASYFIEEFGLIFFVEVLNFDEKIFNFIVVDLSGKMVAKLILAVAVVIINYLFSKFVIFKKSSKGN